MKKLFIIFVLIFSILNANIDEAKKAYYAKDFKRALHMFEELSKSGNAEANYYLGTMYAFPYGIKQDYKKAFEYYTIAANKPNKRRLKSIFNIAIMYSKGWGVKKDDKKTFEFLTILDKKNIGVAQFMMCMMYSNGDGVEEDEEKAVMYCEKGCNSIKNYPKSCYAAGHSYEKGIGVEQNYSIAKKYYKKACEAGIQESCEAIKNMQEPETFLEKFLKRSWLNILIIIFSLFMLWKYRKKKN